MADPFDDYFLSGPGANFTCQNNPFKCRAPSACALSTTNRRRYCCDQGNVCWAGSTNCNADGSTRKCGEEGKTQWCCLQEDERCTLHDGQINICWSTKPNIMNKLKVPDINAAFSSMSSKNPEATRYPFQPSALLAEATTSSTPSPVVASPSETNQPENQSSGRLPGGAIAGIVVGAIAGILIGGLVTWWLLKKRRRGNAAAKLAELPPGYQDKGYYDGNPQPHIAEMPTEPIVELPASPAPDQQHARGQESARYQVSEYTGSSHPSAHQPSTHHSISPHDPTSYR